MAESVVTNTAKRKILQARAGLIPSLPKIEGMVFGDGAIRLPLPTDNALQHELHRQKIDNVTVQEDGLSVAYSVTLAKATMVGYIINEIALYDEDGDLLAIKSFSGKGKDGDMEMVFEITDKF